MFVKVYCVSASVIILCCAQMSRSENEVTAIEMIAGEFTKRSSAEKKTQFLILGTTIISIKGKKPFTDLLSSIIEPSLRYAKRGFRLTIEKIFSACKKGTHEFDGCMKRAFNKLRPYFKIGIPEMGVAPFDPHFAPVVKQKRSMFGIGYLLTLTDVYERGWTQSFVTKYKTDWQNERIIYSQYFPEKYLEGNYNFEGNALGLKDTRTGHWNLTLRDYSQTTRVKRNGSGVDVHVEIDHIGGMEIHVGNLLRGRSVLEVMLDRVINAAWKPGFAVIRPLINDLVSTAFTDIWSKSFHNFPVDNFLK